MDLKKSKLLLDKINALHHNMSADPDNVSSIEQDLMKSYVRQFYEAFLNLPTGKTAPAPKVTLRKPVPKPKPKPIPAPPPPPPKKEAAPPPPPPPPPVEKPAPKPTPPPPPPAPKPAPVAVAISADMEELFDTNSGSHDLSEKLSQTPIKDIKKAMGINERIFTMNELFGGDQAAFEDTLKALNGFSDFGEAKKYLAANAATKFKWLNKANKKKAKTFVKLVRRRFA